MAAHKFIIENLNQNITIRSLLNMVSINEHKLQSGFKTLFGSTIKQHIRKLRMQKARQLILQENYLVSEAGYDVGYTNLSHFTIAFRQEYGILPGDLKGS